MSDKVSANELLTTLILYIRFQNVKTVGRMLLISPVAVRTRLEGLMVEARPTGCATDVVMLNGIERLVGAIKKLEAQGAKTDLRELTGPYWTVEEDQLLSTSANDEVLSVLLCRSVQAIRFRRRGGGPGQGSGHRRWSEAESAFVLASPLTVAEIAAKLGRTTAATQKHRDRLRRLQE